MGLHNRPPLTLHLLRRPSPQHAPLPIKLPTPSRSPNPPNAQRTAPPRTHGPNLLLDAQPDHDENVPLRRGAGGLWTHVCDVSGSGG